MKKDYLIVFDKLLNDLKGKKLLLHSCCAPCSSSVILQLKDYFDITILYYNPNVFPQSEYEKRKQEQIKLINLYNEKYGSNIKILDCEYNHMEFLNLTKGMVEKEGGKRCSICFRLRLSKTCELAKGYDLFGTTLTVSPYKNADTINSIGKELESKYNIPYLVSDFKKRDGYLKSIKLSKEYNIYRQHYCGCEFSEKSDESVS